MDTNDMILAAVARVEEDVKLLKHHITGNGTPDRGVIVRLDRLERRDADRREREKTIFALVAGAVVTGCGSLVVAVTRLFH